MIDAYPEMTLECALKLLKKQYGPARLSAPDPRRLILR